MVRVHYIFDPMCGWCFGATSLMAELAHHPEIELVLHPGGMMQRAPISVDFRQHILQADQRITAQTGQSFGEAYLERVSSGAPLILDSYQTAQAIIAAEQVGIAAFEMLKAIQKAHYIDGKLVASEETLSELALQLGADQDAWQQAMQAASSKVDSQVANTRGLMEQYGQGGFPSLLVEQQGQMRSVRPSDFYGQSQRWKSFWQQVVNH